MLAIMEQWDGENGCHKSKIDKYILLLILKLGIDVSVFYLCCQKCFKFFVNMCSLSIVLFDLLLVFLMATVWFLGNEKSLMSPCFILANASAAYEALPLPMMFLGLLDYCLQGAILCNQNSFLKPATNAILTLLMWILVVTYTFSPVQNKQMELDNVTQTILVVCKVDGSIVVTYFVVGLFMGIICTMLPFCPLIPFWLKEANRISIVREGQEKKRSDLFTSTTWIVEKGSKKIYLKVTNWPRPPLWFSLTLGFGLFWMPYLSVSVVCLLLHFRVPAYLTVNILWLECANSFLLGLVFWIKSTTQGPYSQLPENVCSWHVFWHLSKGTQWQTNFVAVLNSSKERENTFFCV